MIIIEEIHDNLNPLIWENDELRPEVRDKLILIKERFIQGLIENDIPIEEVDTRIVGSNASYNYSNTSDLDLHIIADIPDRMLRIIYNFYKTQFNQKYDIKIKGINTEIYIEDKDSTSISNGIYSLDEGRWIKFPSKIIDPQVDITEASKYMIDKYEDILALNNKDEASKFLDTLYANRQRSLSLEGEFGIDNLIFKDFRNKGYIQKLKDIIRDGESYEMSLESLIRRI